MRYVHKYTGIEEKHISFLIQDITTGILLESVLKKKDGCLLSRLYCFFPFIPIENRKTQLLVRLALY